jgi:cytochrome P450
VSAEAPAGYPIPRPPPLRSAVDSLKALLAAPLLLRAVFAVLRRFAPVLSIRGNVVLSRHADVVDALARDGELSVEPTNGKKMNALGVPFILGMDPSARYTLERSWLDRCVRPEDLAGIRTRTRARCEEILDAAAPRGWIDAGSEYARAVAITLVQDYFGVPGPDSPTLMRWMRALFHDLFLNLGDAAGVHARAVSAARELAEYLAREIEARGHDEPTTVLTRMIQLRAQDPALDADGIRRSISGVIVGAVDTTNKAFCQAIDQLLRRPRALAAARSAAARDDVEEVGRHVFEALRFNPHNPVIVRTASRSLRLGRETPREIEPGTRVFAATLSAMFDAAAFAEPGSFDARRKEKYLQFGGGIHECLGERINRVTLPVLATALLRRPGVRRRGLLRGRIWYDGPFPDSLQLRLGAAGSPLE